MGKRMLRSRERIRLITALDYILVNNIVYLKALLDFRLSIYKKIGLPVQLHRNYNFANGSHCILCILKEVTYFSRQIPFRLGATQ